MTTDWALLSEYTAQGSEPAFREVVTRYVNLVYATAVRWANGDTHLAEDIVQTVFSDLARLAPTLTAGVRLGGWLHRRTCHVAWTIMRGERRRQNRERQAAEMKAMENPSEADSERIAPILDEAINQLGAQDRTAILLRFFEGHDLRSVGEMLGSSEDAAQKRITRALERLRRLLARQGVTASAAMLAGTLSAQVLTVAPAGLAASVSAAAVAGAASAGGTTLIVLKLLAMSKLKIVLGALVTLGLGTTLMIEHRALQQLRAENQTLEQQIARLTAQAESPSHTPDAQTRAQPPSSLRDQQLKELQRLRGEVGIHRQQSNDLASLRTTNRDLRIATDEPDDPAEADFREQTKIRMEHLKQWGLSFILYAQAHQGQLPESFEQAVNVQNSESLLEFDTNHFEIVYRGNQESIVDPGKTIIFREKEARCAPNGQWSKVYGLADGHVEVHTEPEEANFAAWEKERVMRPR